MAKVGYKLLTLVSLKPIEGGKERTGPVSSACLKCLKQG